MAAVTYLLTVRKRVGGTSGISGRARVLRKHLVGTLGQRAISMWSFGAKQHNKKNECISKRGIVSFVLVSRSSSKVRLFERSFCPCTPSVAIELALNTKGMERLLVALGQPHEMVERTATFSAAFARAHLALMWPCPTEISGHTPLLSLFNEPQPVPPEPLLGIATYGHCDSSDSTRTQVRSCPGKEANPLPRSRNAKNECTQPRARARANTAHA